MIVRHRRDERILRVERLEDRRVLAAVTVGNNLDVLNGDTSSIANLIANDGGDGVSLREAIVAANSTAGADTITFESSVFIGGASNVVGLSGSELLITEALTIDASALAENVTIDAQQNSRVVHFSASTGDLTLKGLNIQNGYTTGAYDRGGGVLFNSGDTLTLTGSTVSGNTTTGSRSLGGGIYTRFGDLTLTNSTVSGNTTTGQFANGGGIYTRFRNLTLTNSTVSGNTTTGRAADGGGIYAYYGSVALNASTVSGNSSGDYGGGIFSFYGSLTLSGSLVAGNTASGAGNEIGSFGATVSLDAYNLIGDSTQTTAGALSGVAAGPTDILATSNGSNPTALASILNTTLADNGGPTLTHALPAGSPAINAGDPGFVGPPNSDQRGAGFDRVQGGRIDIGAVEVQTAPVLLSFTRQNPTAQTTNADTLVFRAAFDESVVGVDPSDFVVVGGTTATITAVTPISGALYDLTVSGGDLAGGNFPVSLDVSGSTNITDLAGNALTPGEPATDESFTVDNAGPAVTNIFRNLPPVELTNADQLLFRVEFDQAVQNVDATDFFVDGATTAMVTNVSASNGQNFDVTVSGGDLAGFDGAVGLGVSFDSSDIVDGVGNPLTPNAPIINEGFTLDNTGPVALSFNRQNPGGQFTDADTLVFRATFDEDALNVDAADFSVSGGSTASVTNVLAVNASTYDVTVSGGDLAGFNGTVGLDLAGGSNISDLLGNVQTPAEPAIDQTYGLANLSSVVVSTLDDIVDDDFSSGQVSLREAIAFSNALASVTTINFDNSLSGGTILLGGTQLQITGTVTIDASALAENVTIDAQRGSRVVSFSAPTGDLTLNSLNIQNGSTTGAFEKGGGVRFDSDGTLTLTGSTVSGNTTTGRVADGGGIYADSGAVMLTNSTVSGNTTTGQSASGGGILTRSGSVTLTNSTVSGNRAEGNLGDGGGIYTDSGAATLTNSTVSGNTSGDDGGGIYTDSGAVTLTNSTVSGNRAEGNLGDGGGIFTDDSTVRVLNSTITNNTAAGVGGGISLLADNFTDDERLIVRNSIVALNTDNGTAPDILAPGDPVNDLTVDYSLIGDTTGSGVTGGTGTGNLLNVDPLLGPLANNGGPTLTHALLPGSPAIDAGGNSVIEGLLFNTGVDSQGNLLGDSVDDPHYTLFSQPGGGGLTDETVPADGFPIPPWLPNEADSRWIGPSAVDAVGPAGEYVYRTTFDLTGLDFANLDLQITGRWASDNNGTDIRINGVGTGQTNQEFEAFSTFSIDSGFVPGVNTLDFVVQNSLDIASPAGLIVDDIQLVANRTSDQRGFTAPVDLPGVPNATAGNARDIGAYEIQIAPSADFDSDGDVDFADFMTLQRGFGTTSGAVLADGNSDDDGDVDASDQAAWRATFGQGSVAPVPPVTAVVSDGLVNVLLSGPGEAVAAEPVRPAVEEPVDALFSALASVSPLGGDFDIRDDEQEPDEPVDRLFEEWDGEGVLV